MTTNFIAFAAAHGLIINRIESGRWVRVPTTDHPKSKNGAYFFDGDYGHAQNWATMPACETWRDDRQMTPRETEALKARMEASRLMQQAERKRNQAKAAEKARFIIGQCRHEPHAYLDSKGFKDMAGLVWSPDQNTNLLVIPMRSNGAVVGCQLVDVDGNKKFLTGQKTNDAEHVIGSAGVDVWCEGYATALSIHAAAKAIKVPCRVHACFSAGNLQRMARTGFVVADCDASQTGEKAAQATGLPYWMPEQVGTDFNDYHAAVGTFAAGMELRKWLQKASRERGSEPRPREKSRLQGA